MAPAFWLQRRLLPLTRKDIALQLLLAASASSKKQT